MEEEAIEFAAHADEEDSESFTGKLEDAGCMDRGECSD